MTAINSMHTNNAVSRFISTLRDTHPQMTELFMHGQCYSLFLILRLPWPQAKALYSPKAGHVYVEIDGAIYDIRGRQHILPDDLGPLDHRGRGYRPHRWPRSDRRRLRS